jgi:hypothetical protein
MRSAIVLLPCLTLLVVAAACDEKEAKQGGAAVAADAATAAPPPSSAASLASAPAPDAATSTLPPSSDGGMPPRPVPKTSPTVGSGMPMETQMQAIAYMAAMGQPRFDDPQPDATYAQTLATQLKSIAMSLDHGSAEEKGKLNRVEVAAGGRKIDILLANGCDAETPRRAVVTRASTPLSTLFGHGVLVVRCNDAHVQCLQSTRDPTDVLCTTAPRHK